MYKGFLIVMCLIIIALTGCGGLIGEKMTPEPQYKPSDVDRTCENIERELAELTDRRDEVAKKISIKHGFNALNVGVGFLTFFNWFVVDLSTDEEVALKSIDTRLAYVREGGIELECNVDNFKTMEEIKAETAPLAPAPQTGNASDNDVEKTVVIEGKTYKMVESVEPKPCEDTSECPFIKRDQRRRNVPWLCCPPID